MYCTYLYIHDGDESLKLIVRAPKEHFQTHGGQIMRPHKYSSFCQSVCRTTHTQLSFYQSVCLTPKTVVSFYRS